MGPYWYIMVYNPKLRNYGLDCRAAQTSFGTLTRASWLLSSDAVFSVRGPTHADAVTGITFGKNYETPEAVCSFAFELEV